MPLDPASETVVAGLRHVPSFAHGLVRDIRVRWALEEIGRPYRAELFDAMTPRPDDYRQWQPFGQVPALDDGQVRLFESGAILLYLGEQDERLMPREPQERWAVTSWLIAALNSVEPALMQIVTLDVFQAGKPWTREARPSAVEFAKSRLTPVAEALGDREWLVGRFSIADIMMITVLRNLRHTDIITEFPLLAAYQARGEARSAFQRALADQAAGLGDPVKAGERT
ncbi:MAG TPA: glutathione S-transferase family protein [Novosphingobium sp.]